MATAIVGNEKEKEETIIIRHYVAWASACVCVLRTRNSKKENVFEERADSS